jgi:hypothetical protein
VMGEYDREAVIVAKLLGVEEIPALTRQRLLHDPVLHHLMRLAVMMYEENERLKFDLEEARSETRMAEGRLERSEGTIGGHGPGYD